MGKGRVAVFGEAAMFSAQQLAGGIIWRFALRLSEEMTLRMQLVGHRRFGMNAPEAKQNHQLLLNVMHWLSRVEGMRE